MDADDNRYYAITNIGNRSTVKELPSRLGAWHDEFACEQVKTLLLRFCLGWSVATSFTERRKKQMTKEALASSRTKRMMTKIRKKYGFFCDEFIQRELDEKPSYFQGYIVYTYDEMEEYCAQWEGTLSPAEILGRIVTLGIPPINPRLAELQANRERLLRQARERLNSPEYRAAQERKKKEREEAEKRRKAEYEQWVMRPDRDEDSLFFERKTSYENTDRPEFKDV